ncbi:carboxymuconolactone decarboxylase family protein [Undibacterium sp. LX40W]|uniref:Carboxymuconolactone decarboxylase family protein n=1 Tax=Undibacterium nitidum TaxID=2762298 RepID=A0A923HQW6_9BURK|nr:MULTISPECIES: carboxymuconolactone decarboxylase family protein [Undibacterium]MBC3881630.1 carboxymuconolactone decarboxylase family protein [Undibacterium nitidum]MBC3891587.1 carboxymuconolactone decarboxylase family protein [Undibacterium sp. LX40W]
MSQTESPLHNSTSVSGRRIPHQDDAALGPADVVDAIRQRRGGQLLNLDRMLLNSPAYATGWNHFLGAVRNRLSLNAEWRELAICAVAILTNAPYEYSQHAPEYLSAGGTQAKLDALHRWAHVEPQLKSENGALEFTEAEASVIALAREMTLQVQVSDASFRRLQAVLPDPTQQVELVGVIAAYNMVARFLEALQVAPE